jgi:hypothetical protein
MFAPMPRYAPAASDIHSVPRIPATGQNGSSRHVLALFNSSSRRIIECRSGALIRCSIAPGHRLVRKHEIETALAPTDVWLLPQTRRSWETTTRPSSARSSPLSADSWQSRSRNGPAFLRPRTATRSIAGTRDAHRRYTSLDPAGITPGRARTTSSRGRRPAGNPTAPTARPPATGLGSPRLASSRRRRRQDRDTVAALVGHLGPDDLIPGRHDHRHNAGTPEPLCRTELVTSSPISRRRDLSVRAGFSECPGHQCTGRPYLLRHRQDRHTPGIRCLGHNATTLRRLPRPVRRRAQDGCTLHSARPVKPETPAAAARPWPSVETPAVTPTVKTPRAGPLCVRGYRNRAFCTDPQ